VKELEKRLVKDKIELENQIARDKEEICEW